MEEQGVVGTGTIQTQEKVTTRWAPSSIPSAPKTRGEQPPPREGDAGDQTLRLKAGSARGLTWARLPGEPREPGTAQQEGRQSRDPEPSSAARGRSERAGCRPCIPLLENEGQPPGLSLGEIVHRKHPGQSRARSKGATPVHLPPSRPEGRQRHLGSSAPS